MAEINESTRLLEGENASNQEKASCWIRTKTFIRSITVEPALAMILFGIGLETVFITSLWVDKICYFHFNYSQTICENIDSGNYPEEQNNVQRITNHYNVYTHILQYLPAVVVVLFLGSWGDTRGRRFPIIIPFLGYFLTSLGVTAISFWWTLPPVYLLVCYVPLAFTGGLIGVYSGIYPYLSTVTSNRSRTSRISIVAVVIMASVVIGQATALMVYKKGGYVAIFGSQAALSAGAIIYSFLRLEDRPSGDTLPENPQGILHVFSPSRIKKTVLVVFQERSEGKRGDILGHLSIMMLLVFVAGSYNYNFLYTRKRFSWDHNTYTVYSVVDTSVSAFGILVIVPLLSYKWNVEDSILGLMGGVSLLFSSVLKATAPVPWVLYLGSAAGLCLSQITAASRGAVSKQVSKSELGAVFAVLAAGEALVPMAAAATFTAIYNATVSLFPGTIYILTSVLSIFICVLYVWMLTRNRQLGQQDDFPQRNIGQVEVA